MEFVCTDPAATVRGLNVLATVEAFQLVPAFAAKMLERHGIFLSALRANVPVPVQRWLDVLREVAEQVGDAKLRTVGAKIVENANFPPCFTTVESVLLALDDIYHLNHDGRIGRYASCTEKDGGIRIECETPYPRAFERGLVEGIARNAKLAHGKRYDVRYEEGPRGRERTCTLHVIAL